jgi:hypothetical protein
LNLKLLVTHACCAFGGGVGRVSGQSGLNGSGSGFGLEGGATGSRGVGSGCAGSVSGLTGSVCGIGTSLWAEPNFAEQKSVWECAN